MSDFSLETILAPISPDNPTGPNLEYDPTFMALERAMKVKPEQQIGSTIVPAQEPDWPEVTRLSTELLSRCKHLRAASALAQALLRLRGLPGFADGTLALRGLVERYWDSLHPQLDPDEPDDQAIRINVLAGLNDPFVLNAVRAAPLVTSRVAGRFSLKDLEIASGESAAPPGAEAPSMTTIEAAVLDSDLAALRETATAARVSFESIKAVEAFLADKIGPENGPPFNALSALLKKASTFLAASTTLREPAAEAGDGAAAGSVPDRGSGNAAAGGRSTLGPIGSREDVLRALDQICRYYAKYEPSSPVPMFLERCQRLVSMTFVDIVRDLAPEGLGQVEVLRGGENK